MNKKIFLVIFSLIMISCKSEKKLNYANELSNCLSDKDIELLNEATYIFEKKLSEYYGDKNDNKNFISYLNDLGSIPPALKPPEFYYNDQTLKILKEVRRTGLYNKIWRDYHPENSSQDDLEIIELEGYDETEGNQLKMAFLNPQGEYLNCINENYSNRAIKKVLIAQSEYGDIASSVIASVLKNQFKEKDFDNGINKVIVAISAYYDMTILLNDNPKP